MAIPKSNEGLKVRSQIKAGGFGNNRNEGLKVRSKVKAGGRRLNRNEGLKVRSKIKAGGFTNRNERPKARGK